MSLSERSMSSTVIYSLYFMVSKISLCFKKRLSVSFLGTYILFENVMWMAPDWVNSLIFAVGSSYSILLNFCWSSNLSCFVLKSSEAKLSSTYSESAEVSSTYSLSSCTLISKLIEKVLECPPGLRSLTSISMSPFTVSAMESTLV